MKLIVMETESNPDWVGTLGCTRNALIQKVLRGGWFEHPSPDAVLHVQEGAWPFALKFSRSLPQDMIGEDYVPHATFEIVFNDSNKRKDVLLRNVLFGKYKDQKYGTQFLARVADVMLDLNCSRIFLVPDRDGSAFWTSRGARIQKWPSHDTSEFDVRLAHLLAKDKLETYGWSDNDRAELKSAMKKKDVAWLNQLADRDDVWIRRGKEFVSPRRYVFQDVKLDECVFDFDDTHITQPRFLKRVGYDIVAERARRGRFVPDIPGSTLYFPQTAVANRL